MNGAAAAPTREAVTVRYWAAARAAAGVDADDLPVRAGRPLTVAEVGDLVVAARPALERVLPRCSFLLDGRRAQPTSPVPAGSTLEVLPPFAGG